MPFLPVSSSFSWLPLPFIPNDVPLPTYPIPWHTPPNPNWFPGGTGPLPLLPTPNIDPMPKDEVKDIGLAVPCSHPQNPSLRIACDEFALSLCVGCAKKMFSLLKEIFPDVSHEKEIFPDVSHETDDLSDFSLILKEMQKDSHSFLATPSTKQNLSVGKRKLKC